MIQGNFLLKGKTYSIFFGKTKNLVFVTAHLMLGLGLLGLAEITQANSEEEEYLIYNLHVDQRDNFSRIEEVADYLADGHASDEEAENYVLDGLSKLSPLYDIYRKVNQELQNYVNRYPIYDMHLHLNALDHISDNSPYRREVNDDPDGHYSSMPVLPSLSFLDEKLKSNHSGNPRDILSRLKDYYGGQPGKNDREKFWHLMQTTFERWDWKKYESVALGRGVLERHQEILRAIMIAQHPLTMEDLQRVIWEEGEISHFHQEMTPPEHLLFTLAQLNYLANGIKVLDKETVQQLSKGDWQQTGRPKFDGKTKLNLPILSAAAVKEILATADQWQQGITGKNQEVINRIKQRQQENGQLQTSLTESLTRIKDYDTEIAKLNPDELKAAKEELSQLMLQQETDARIMERVLPNSVVQAFRKQHPFVGQLNPSRWDDLYLEWDIYDRRDALIHEKQLFIQNIEDRTKNLQLRLGKSDALAIIPALRDLPKILAKLLKFAEEAKTAQGAAWNKVIANYAFLDEELGKIMRLPEVKAQYKFHRTPSASLNLAENGPANEDELVDEGKGKGKGKGKDDQQYKYRPNRRDYLLSPVARYFSYFRDILDRLPGIQHDLDQLEPYVSKVEHFHETIREINKLRNKRRDVAVDAYLDTLEYFRNIFKADVYKEYTEVYPPATGKITYRKILRHLKNAQRVIPAHAQQLARRLKRRQELSHSWLVYPEYFYRNLPKMLLLQGYRELINSGFKPWPIGRTWQFLGQTKQKFFIQDMHQFYMGLKNSELWRDIIYGLDHYVAIEQSDYQAGFTALDHDVLSYVFMTKTPLNEQMVRQILDLKDKIKSQTYGYDEQSDHRTFWKDVDIFLEVQNLASYLNLDDYDSLELLEQGEWPSMILPFPAQYNRPLKLVDWDLNNIMRHVINDKQRLLPLFNVYQARSALKSQKAASSPSTPAVDCPPNLLPPQ